MSNQPQGWCQSLGRKYQQLLFVHVGSGSVESIQFKQSSYLPFLAALILTSATLHAEDSKLSQHQILITLIEKYLYIKVNMKVSVKD